jgi:hypothetical protein
VPAFIGLDRVFAPGAEIVFHSCSVAEGADGKRFLEDVARTLLRKGGRVTAPLWYYAGGTPRLRSAVGPLGGKLEGWSLAGWLRFELRPDGTGSFKRLLPGTQETRELGQTLSDQGRDAYRRVESRARAAAGAAAAGARRAESGARAAWSRAASLLPKPGGLGRLFDGR